MGREQRRREQFKNKNKKSREEELDTSIKWTTVVKLICFIVILLFVIYYILAVFVTKELDISNGSDTKENTTEETTDTSSVSDKILASNIFNQKEEEYYVYFYDFNDEDDVVNSVISSITDTKVYKVDTSSSLNANYVTEDKGNKDALNLDELKVKNPTVIKVEADEITEYYEGSNNIYKGLNK